MAYMRVGREISKGSRSRMAHVGNSRLARTLLRRRVALCHTLASSAEKGSHDVLVLYRGSHHVLCRLCQALWRPALACAHA